MGHIIGIDLGTTNSLAAYWHEGESRLIPNALGKYLTPSVVSVEENGTVYVGEAAKERLISHPDQTVSVFKRSMGTERTWQLGGKWYRPEELSALVLRKLKEDAEKYLGEPVEEAVISVPAYFGDNARRATRDAGKLAGLKVERIVNEPSAAALACQHIRKQKEAKMLVYDFGGGTLDVSLVQCFENIIEIIAVSGDNQLGGSDFDRLIAEKFCIENNMQGFGMQPKNVQQSLLQAAEYAKKRLTRFKTAIMAVQTPETSGAMELTQKSLISLSGNLLKRMADPINTVLRDGHIRISELTQVVLVGGSTKMPLVQQYLRFILKGVPLVTVDPDYMVAIGVGVYAGIKERNAEIKDLIMTDICPFSLGTDIKNEADIGNPYMSVIIPRNSALPASRTHTYTNAEDNQTCSKIGIFQGEDMYVKNNVKLGSLIVTYPPAKKCEREINVRFTYDINGLLVVNVSVPFTGEERELVFTNGREVENTDDDTRKRVEELKRLQLVGRDQEAEKLLLARAQHFYALVTGAERERIQEYVSAFEESCRRGFATEARKKGEELKELLDSLEERMRDELAAEEDMISGFMDWMNGFDTDAGEPTGNWNTIL